MYSKQHRTAKTGSDSHDTPASNQFAPRPFVVQPQTEEVKPQQDQTDDLQTKAENIKEVSDGFPDPAVFTRHLTPPRTPRVQMKLNIGKPGDKYEQEADKVAADVVQRNAPVAPSADSNQIVQRQDEEIQDVTSKVNKEEVEQDVSAEKKGVSEVFAQKVEDNNAQSLNNIDPRNMSIGELASAITAGGQDLVNSWVGNHDILLGILLNQFEANWFKARDCLTMDSWPASVKAEHRPPHALSLNLMQGLVNMRINKWEAFAALTKPLITQEIQKFRDAQNTIFQTNKTNEDLIPSDDPKKDLDIAPSVGSTAVTSDIDLALEGKYTEIGVGLINSKFREHFGVPFDPGAVFDINVYTLNWMHGKTETTQNRSDTQAVFRAEPEERARVESSEEKKQRDESLEIWSLVKIRRNMDRGEWLNYKVQLLGNIKNDESRNAMSNKLDVANIKFQQFKQRVKTKTAEIVAALEEQENLLHEAYERYQATAFDKEYLHEAYEMRGSNARYEEINIEVKDLRLRLDKLRQVSQEELDEVAIINLSKQLADKISEGLTFANEVYASEGAVLHTVYGMQVAKGMVNKIKAEPGRENVTTVKFDFTPEQYLQSMNENVGDSLHSLHHFQKQPQYAVYRAGKYLDRMCIAANSLLNPEKAKVVPHYETLYEIGQESVKAKGGNVGNDPMAVNQGFFGEFSNKEKLTPLRNQIIEFGAKASAEFHNQPASPHTAEQPASDGHKQETPLNNDGAKVKALIEQYNQLIADHNNDH